MKTIELVIYKDGTKEWCLNNLLSREGGPAIIESDGYKQWWINGNLVKMEDS